MARPRKQNRRLPKLDREQSLQAVPILNQLIAIDYDADGNAVLNLPRKRTSAVRLMAKVFGLAPYKRIELDELGTCVVQLCDGSRTVQDIIVAFAERFRLSRRETEVSMLTYLKTLAKRGIIGFALPNEPPPQA